MIYARKKVTKCPNFTIFARKIFFQNFFFGGGALPGAPATQSFVVSVLDCRMQNDVVPPHRATEAVTVRSSTCITNSQYPPSVLRFPIYVHKIYARLFFTDDRSAEGDDGLTT